MPDLTAVEKLAEQAEDLPAFQGFKLIQLKTKIAEVLTQFGRQGLFEEYTKHDMIHIDEMLRVYNWLIPETAKASMSPADWLMLTCATYLHDVGLVVTREEFGNRENSGFPEYQARILRTDDPNGRDYKAYLKSLDRIEHERFLYQEFVRDHHASRIRSWLTESPDASIGFDPQLSSELSSMLTGLEPVFVADLGLVCESHHREDLYDLGKYSLSRPYGNSDEETANVQYAAICLRASDLLHITRDRTPSIAWKLINPNNPDSQREWAKQRAVRRVRPQQGHNRDGVPDPDAPQDTIEVHAEFNDPEGFFGLIGYLAVAQKELQQCFTWATRSCREFGSNMEFPWRYIDKSQVHATGFMSRKFQFTFDEGKILELLTGHTLYNDSSVVVRETLQNSLDAVRLQCLSDKCNCAPEVQVKWTNDSQIFEVIDNGTGMTLDIIEQNFLRVGSSRYQEAGFRRDYPEFSPISRFGIGVLSTFMVSDEVQVITCVAAEDSAREISLRSVQGEYLIRMIRKSDSEVPDLIKSHGHGTVMRVKVRRSADLSDILSVLKRWLVIPRAKVTFIKDDQAPVNIGFPDLTAALRSAIMLFDSVQEDGTELRTQWGEQIEIRSKRSENAEIAYVVNWNPFFQEWSFWCPPELDVDHRTPQAPAAADVHFGICIEGIRVESGCPGLPGGGLAAIANAVGRRAPRTNVARTALEQTPELDSFLSELYRVYSSHLADEAARCMLEHGFSATKAASQVQYLVNPISRTSSRASTGAWSERLKLNALCEVPAFVTEYSGKRELVSMTDVEKFGSFYTYDSDMIRRLESLLIVLPGTIALEDIARLGKSEEISKLSSGARRVSLKNHGIFARLFRSRWEPESIEAHGGGLLSVSWKAAEDRWVGDDLVRPSQLSEPVLFLRNYARRAAERFPGRFSSVYLPAKPVSATGFGDYDAVRIGNDIYVLPNCPILGLASSPTLSTYGGYERHIIVCTVIRLLQVVQTANPAPGRFGRQFAPRQAIEDMVRENPFSEFFDTVVKDILQYKFQTFDVVQYDRSGLFD